MALHRQKAAVQGHQGHSDGRGAEGLGEPRVAQLPGLFGLPALGDVPVAAPQAERASPLRDGLALMGDPPEGAILVEDPDLDLMARLAGL